MAVFYSCNGICHTLPSIGYITEISLMFGSLQHSGQTGKEKCKKKKKKKKNQSGLVVAHRTVNMTIAYIYL